MLSKVKPNKFPKRLSVDAGLNPHGLLSTKLKRESMAVSKQLYRQLPSIPSKSNLSQDDGYQTLTKKVSETDTRKQIKIVFQKLSTKEGQVTLDVIENCLLQLGQDPKYAVDMLQLLDLDNFGYIQEHTFVDYFLRRPIEAEYDNVPEFMEKKADIVKFISEKGRGLKSLEDPQFCEKVMKQFCRQNKSSFSI